MAEQLSDVLREWKSLEEEIKNCTERTRANLEGKIRKLIVRLRTAVRERIEPTPTRPTPMPTPTRPTPATPTRPTPATRGHDE